MTVVSPMMFGEEQKDQDRARFFGPGLVGCVCDGVTSSPRSEKAAELVTSLAPTLFGGSLRERLGMVCDLLTVHRQEFQAAHVAAPQDVPEAMRTMIEEIFREKQAISFQTTMVATRIRPNRGQVVVDVLRCGDSALLVYSADGELLSSSLAPPVGRGEGRYDRFHSRRFRFGSGDQILVRVEGSLGAYESRAANSGISDRYAENWIVCTPVDACHKAKASPSRSPALVLGPDDRLLVPRYLYGQALESQGQEYRCLDYSSTIRIWPTSPPGVWTDGIEHRGSVTAVLPDHFYSGHYDCYEDRFPGGTHFVLCSDGFYSAFATASEMWAWLQENKDVLAKVQEREPKLTELHHRLHEKGGDDDMSFVWMSPASSAVLDGDEIERQ
jgi:hypothetical protein